MYQNYEINRKQKNISEEYHVIVVSHNITEFFFKKKPI